MAIGAAKRGSPGPSTAKKSHGTRSKKKKLRVNERVEVRSEEAGSLGSWHQGIVMASGHRRRCVKFDHILVEDGSESVVEHVDVPPTVDGVDSEELHLHPHYRGSIRPLPPDISTGPWDLPYGACVDVYHLEAWWEGVIFDHNDGVEERTVFFPDQGDELLAALSSIRATATWNEVTESWRRRGPWLFLEVIEEFEKEWPLPVSVKQIWYDLRERYDFDKIKEWTSTDKAVWQVLVRDTISENLMVALKDVLPQLANPRNRSSCQTDAAKMDCGPRVESVGEEEGFTGSKPEKLAGPCAITGPPETDDDNGPRECSHKKPSLENLQPLTGATESPRFSSPEIPSLEMASKPKSRESRKWQPAVPDLVPGGAASPEAIARYNRGKDVKHHDSLVADVRKHLVHLGWKIEFSYASDQLLRFRYISPEGKGYFSLVKVCKDLAGTSNNEETLPGFTTTVSMQDKGINPDTSVPSPRSDPLKNVSAKRLKTASKHKKRKREMPSSMPSLDETVDGVVITDGHQNDIN